MMDLGEEGRAYPSASARVWSRRRSKDIVVAGALYVAALQRSEGRKEGKLI